MGEAKKSIKWIIGWLMIAAMIVAAAMFVYMLHLKKALSESVFTTTYELVSHDTRIIQLNMENAWSGLEAITERIRQEKNEDISGLLKVINVEQLVSDFEQIYLVDENGRTYSSYGLIFDDFSEPYIQRILSGEKRIATLYSGEGEDHTALKKDLIVYGTWVEPIQAGDIRIVGIIGLESIKAIEDELNVESFGGRGYTGVIDERGRFVVNVNQGNSLGDKDNFFTMLEEGQLSGDATIEEIKNKISERENFSVSYVNANNEEIVVILVPIPDSKWTILMSVEMVVFEEMNSKFITMTVCLLAAVVVGFIIMSTVIMKSVLSSRVAEADSRTKNSFLSSMSHEIRTPLNGLIGLIYLMQHHIQEPPKLEVYLDKASSTARYLLTLVNDILDMQKLSQQSMKLSKEPFVVMQLVESTESLMRERMETGGITFTVNSQVEKAEIIGDQIRIQQVLLNILSNAAKFTPAGGNVCMTVNQEVETERKKVLTIFEISDTGCGMSSEFQKHIFDPFTQEQNKESDGTKGTGLGMSISYQLVQLMGGTIQVESSCGVGSTFTVKIPAVYTDTHKEIKKECEVQNKEAKENEKLHILVAEDNDLNAEILMEIFEAVGHRIVRACDGKEAVEIFAASEPDAYDVILMDVQMPVMNGYDAARAIRSLDRPDAGTVIIFACTANAFKEDRDKAIESGMNDFISKPIDPDKILKKLRGVDENSGGC
ncbi:MAG: ATP-binding protein [Bacillota bacterium]|nr:ATP-binding protein [Bacillota bacterium]